MSSERPNAISGILSNRHEEHSLDAPTVSETTMFEIYHVCLMSRFPRSNKFKPMSVTLHFQWPFARNVSSLVFGHLLPLKKRRANY